MDAEKAIKEAVYRNLSDRVREYVKRKVGKLEQGDARDLIIERSRNAVGAVRSRVTANMSRLSLPGIGEMV